MLEFLRQYWEKSPPQRHSTKINTARPSTSTTDGDMHQTTPWEKCHIYKGKGVGEKSTKLCGALLVHGDRTSAEETYGKTQGEKSGCEIMRTTSENICYNRGRNLVCCTFPNLGG